MFAGSHQLSVDDKGRIAIPARFRQLLAEQCDSQIYITMGTNPCLEIYPAPKFLELAADIQALENRRAAEILKQRFIGLATDAEIDKQGRVLLPPVLRRRAQLNGSAMLMGQITRLDIWAEEVWNAHFGDGGGAVTAEVIDAFDLIKR